ncbi:MAG: SGNH/GDSL hydrolase family protein [Lentisphaerae bacterium]|nr:SGNH/GDSL hydrolase family protein [Lentisphaerota bacterium]
MRSALRMLDVLFLGLLLLAPAIWLCGPLRADLGPGTASAAWGWRPALAPLLLLTARALFKRRACRAGHELRGPLDFRPVNRIALAVAAVFLFLLAFEGVLSLVGFSAELAPIVIRGATPAPAAGSAATVPDPELIWRFNPGADFNGRPINAMGFAEREVDPVKRSGSVRVICMGDSVVGQGIPPFSGFLHAMLTNAPPDARAWEAFNMGVHGYSAVQGLRLFHLQTAGLQPDVVTIQYGWNDHWLSERPDRNRMAVTVAPMTAHLLNALGRKRFFRFISSALGPSGSLAWSGRGAVLRVPPGEYRSALRDFVRDARAAGAAPLLITAPRAQALSPVLVDNRQAASVPDAIRLHDEYNAILREVARDEQAAMLDLAALFSAPEAAPLFADDGIHLQREGRIRLAELLYAALKDLAAATGHEPRGVSRPGSGV